MAGVLTVRFSPPLRDLLGRFARAEGQLLDDKRDAVRGLGRRWVEIAREEAPKHTGEFARSIHFRSFERGGSVGFNAYAKQPLGTFIVRGTPPHSIAARQAGALYFFWPKVGVYAVVPRSGGFKTHMAGGKLWIGKGFVHHPGTVPNEYNVRAYARWKEEARPSMRRIALRYLAVIRG